MKLKIKMMNDGYEGQMHCCCNIWKQIVPSVSLRPSLHCLTDHFWPVQTIDWAGHCRQDYDEKDALHILNYTLRLHFSVLILINHRIVLYSWYWNSNGTTFRDSLSYCEPRSPSLMRASSTLTPSGPPSRTSWRTSDWSLTTATGRWTWGRPCQGWCPGALTRSATFPSPLLWDSVRARPDRGG